MAADRHSAPGAPLDTRTPSEQGEASLGLWIPTFAFDGGIPEVQNRKFAAIKKYKKFLRQVLVPMMRMMSSATEALLVAKAIIGHGCDTQDSFVASLLSWSFR
ncbi:MAG: hypothetical protein LQ341_001211 [Variospora aurantia]|nr:MAG: hypothetical protein LQ341_001211 [Variospora aurantia]